LNNGTDCHSMSLIHHQSTSSRTIWTRHGKIWASIAEKLPRSSTTSGSAKSRLVLPFWYRLTWVVPEKGPLKGQGHIFGTDEARHFKFALQTGRKEY